MTVPGRNGAVDSVRAAALLGICVVNLPFLGLPADVALAPPAAMSDRIAVFVVETFFQAKFFLLFSFAFGWGIHIQEGAAQRAGTSFGRRYRRRLLGLALLGGLHAVLVFSGDILLIYALLGLLIWPVRTASAAALLRFSLGMIPLAALGIAALALLAPEALPAASGPGLGGTLAEATRARLGQWPATFGFLLLFQGPLAFAAFAAGLAAAKADFFAADNAHRRRLANAVPWLLGLGLPLNAFYAAVMGGLVPPDRELLSLAGLSAIALGGPMLAAAYLSVILSAAQRWPLPERLALAGRNSLSAYVLQGVMAGAVFGGYGLGLFGRIGQAELVALAMLIALASMLAAGSVAARYGRGPLEAVLRRLTYAEFK